MRHAIFIADARLPFPAQKRRQKLLHGSEERGRIAIADFALDAASDAIRDFARQQGTSCP